MKLDILAFGAHPDDIELAASGTLLYHQGLGQKIGVVDLSKGELGTRGSAELRMQEAEKAAKILGLSVRENLGVADGFFEIDQTNLMKVVEMIRKYRPEVVFANAVSDRHPDHGGSAARGAARRCRGLRDGCSAGAGRRRGRRRRVGGTRFNKAAAGAGATKIKVVRVVSDQNHRGKPKPGRRQKSKKRATEVPASFGHTLKAARGVLVGPPKHNPAGEHVQREK